MTQKEFMQMAVSVLLGAALAITAIVGWDINAQPAQQSAGVVVVPAGAAGPAGPAGAAGSTEVVVVPGAEQAEAMDFSSQALAGDVTNFGGLEADINSSSVEGLDVDQTGSGDIVVFRDGGSAVWTLADGGGVSSSGAIDTSSTLNVDGAATLNSTLDVDGNLTSGTGSITMADSINVTGAADFDSTVNVDGNLASATGSLTVADSINATGAVDFDSTLNVDGATTTNDDVINAPEATFTVEYGVPITPTGYYQPIDSAASTTENPESNVAAPTDDTVGKRLILHNINATQVITIDGTGEDVECKANVALGAQDALELLWNGDDWICLTNYDNS